MTNHLKNKTYSYSTMFRLDNRDFFTLSTLSLPAMHDGENAIVRWWKYDG